MDFSQGGEVAAADFKYWANIVEGVATAVSGVTVGAALIWFNRRLQKKDAASVIQHRLEPLEMLISASLAMHKKWAETGDSAEYTLDFYAWLPEANTVVALLSNPQFAIFDFGTRGHLFAYRYGVEGLVETAAYLGISLEGNKINFDRRVHVEGSAAFAGGVDRIAELLLQNQIELRQLTQRLFQKFGADSFAIYPEKDTASEQ